MIAKTFEIRDAATFIPAVAVLLNPLDVGQTEADRYLIRRCGWRTERGILFGRMHGHDWHYDPYDWPCSSRTMHLAHHYICEHWDDLESGAVIDVEFISSETKQAKVSEAVFDGGAH